MGLFERHLRELGERRRRLVPRVRPPLDGSAEALATELASLARPGTTPRPTRAATSPSSSAPRSPPPTSRSPARPRRTTSHRLTLFADNLVPHVLRIDGVLVFDPDLVQRIDAGDAARARLARGGRDPRRARCTPSSCSSQAHRQHHRRPLSTTCSGTAAGPALQGASAPPRPNDPLTGALRTPPPLRRASTRSSTRCASAPRSSRSTPATREPEPLAASSRPTSQSLPAIATPGLPGTRSLTIAGARTTTSRGARAPRPVRLPRGPAPPGQPRRGDPRRGRGRRRRRAHDRPRPWHPARSAAPLAFSSRCPSRTSTPCPSTYATADRHRPRRRGAPSPQHAILAFGSERHGLSAGARGCRRAGADPHARRRLQPQSRDRRGRGPLRPHGAVVDARALR